MADSLSIERLDYDTGETVCEAYIARQAGGDGRRPCIPLAHAWDGPNDILRAEANGLTRLGYVAILIDVYGKGVRGDLVGDNTALMLPLLTDRALLRRRLLAALETARRLGSVDPDRIAAIGYCFGGLCALDLARAAPAGLAGVVSFHGVLKPPGLEPQAPIGAKVLVLHGWEAPMAPPEDVLALARELTEAGADWQLHAYGHAMHAFTFKGAASPERGVLYNAVADRRSWAAMLGFMEEIFAT